MIVGERFIISFIECNFGQLDETCATHTEKQISKFFGVCQNTVSCRDLWNGTFTVVLEEIVERMQGAQMTPVCQTVYSGDPMNGTKMKFSLTIGLNCQFNFSFGNIPILTFWG